MNGVRWSMTNHGLAEAYGQLGRGVYGETEFWLKENHRTVESPWVNEWMNEYNYLEQQQQQKKQQQQQQKKQQQQQQEQQQQQ